uniref:DM domain-containing protein n=1 Tax=Acrobeloides nanus TaxID=290746 RepID=A0A914DAJ6_9BILA
MKKFNFKEWDKPLRKEESALFNPNVLQNKKLEPKKRPLQTKVIEPEPLGRTWVPANSVSSHANSIKASSSSVSKGYEQKHMSVKAPRATKATGPIKKRRISDLTEDDEAEPSSTTNVTVSPTKAKPRSIGINIGAIPEIFSKKKLKLEEQTFMERLKNQRNLMRVVIVRNDLKDVVNSREEDDFKRSIGSKMNAKERINKFEQLYEESVSIYGDHFKFLSALDQHRNERGKKLKKVMVVKQANVDKLNEKQKEYSTQVNEQIKVYHVNNSCLSFKEDTVQSIDELKQLAKEQGLFIINGWKFPNQEITRNSRQFDVDGACLYCKTHAAKAYKPHDNCPYKRCPCIECLKFDSNQALDDVSSMLKLYQWPITRAMESK